MKINLRLSDGWTGKIENKSKATCDCCGAKLFKAPHGGIYCDAVHTKEQVESIKVKVAK